MVGSATDDMVGSATGDMVGSATDDWTVPMTARVGTTKAVVAGPRVSLTLLSSLEFCPEDRHTRHAIVRSAGNNIIETKLANCKN